MADTSLSQSQAAALGGLKGWHVALWVVQVFLAISFTLGGTYRLITPIEELAVKMPWAAAVPEAVVRFSAASELAAALGLIFPSWLRVQPRLTPLAAVGLVIVMILAMALHISRSEWNFVPVNLFLASLAAFVAWGRTRKVPIAPRQPG